MRGIEKAHVERYGGKNKGVKREERTGGAGAAEAKEKLSALQNGWCKISHFPQRR